MTGNFNLKILSNKRFLKCFSVFLCSRVGIVHFNCIQKHIQSNFSVIGFAIVADFIIQHVEQKYVACTLPPLC